MVGEGIEHQHQADALRAMGCGRGQGYLFSRPLPAQEMEAYLARSLPWQEESESQLVVLAAPRRSD
jgi:EAL domain-containing protein (putative c-di-GMP-specific phosphodiesterase class I)